MTVNIRELIKENDYSKEIISYETGISRTKIDTAVTAAGYTLPLPNKVSFHYINSAGTVYVMTWFPLLNKYGYEKLTLK